LSAADRAGIDWSRPWFEPLRAWGEALPPGLPVPEALQTLSGGQPAFVAQDRLPAGVPYETYIAQTGCVPTRDNLHDLFNGLMWLRHPELKRHMNRLQAAAIARDGVGARRGAARDALTVFDERGAIWTQPDPVLLDAWRRRDWWALFVVHRTRWANQGFEIVGHALLEQLASAPRKALVAHVCFGRSPCQLDECDWAEKPFLPLPVLGIPGWWAGQEDPEFYTDKQVFRPCPS
jgi:Protein of unknown function (DUF3025)